MSVSRDQLIDLIYDEARMLDEGRYSDWLGLWLDDGHYLMPLDYKQSDPHLVTSPLYEDMFMLRLRVERLNGERTFSQKPKSRAIMSSNALSSTRWTGTTLSPTHPYTTSKPGWTINSCWQ